MSIEIDVLERIGTSASSGLCQITHEGSRCFLKSIRELCTARLDALQRPADEAPDAIEPWMTKYATARLVANQREFVAVAIDGTTFELPRHEAIYLHGLLRSILGAES